MIHYDSAKLCVLKNFMTQCIQGALYRVRPMTIKCEPFLGLGHSFLRYGFPVPDNMISYRRPHWEAAAAAMHPARYVFPN